MKRKSSCDEATRAGVGTVHGRFVMPGDEGEVLATVADGISAFNGRIGAGTFVGMPAGDDATRVQERDFLWGGSSGVWIRVLLVDPAEGFAGAVVEAGVVATGWF